MAFFNIRITYKFSGNSAVRPDPGRTYQQCPRDESCPACSEGSAPASPACLAVGSSPFSAETPSLPVPRQPHSPRRPSRLFSWSPSASITVSLIRAVAVSLPESHFRPPFPPAAARLPVPCSRSPSPNILASRVGSSSPMIVLTVSVALLFLDPSS